jgi:hypothetical protein
MIFFRKRQGEMKESGGKKNTTGKRTRLKKTGGGGWSCRSDY